MMNATNDLIKKIDDFLKVKKFYPHGIKEFYEDSSLKIAFCGAFNTGKSSLINTLLQRNILPTKAVSSTSVSIKLAYSPEEYCIVNYRDGNSKKIALEDLTSYSVLDSSSYNRDVCEIHVFLKSDLLKKGLVLIDTPGLEDDNYLSDITHNTIKNADFLFVIINSQKIFSAYEKRFIFDLYDNFAQSIAFVFNKIDILDQEEFETIEELARAYLRNFKTPYLRDNIAFTVAAGTHQTQTESLNKILSDLLINEKKDLIKQRTRLTRIANILYEHDYNIVNKLAEINNQLTDITQTKKEELDEIAEEKYNKALEVASKLNKCFKNINKYIDVFTENCFNAAKGKKLLTFNNYLAINLLCLLEVVKQDWILSFQGRIKELLLTMDLDILSTIPLNITSSTQDISDSELVFISKFSRCFDNYQADKKFENAFINLLAKESNYLKNDVLAFLQLSISEIYKSKDYNITYNNETEDAIVLELNEHIEIQSNIRNFINDALENINQIRGLYGN